jgi:hypothetical protein
MLVPRRGQGVRTAQPPSARMEGDLQTPGDPRGFFCFHWAAAMTLFHRGLRRVCGQLAELDPI